MRKILLAFLVTLSLAASPIAKLSGSIFKVHTQIEGVEGYGTAFCAPNKANILITANHLVDRDMFVVDTKGTKYGDVKILSEDTKNDIAVIMTEGQPCAVSAMSYAVKNAEPGDEVWLEGWGGGFDVPVTTRGIISSRPYQNYNAHGKQLATINALFGHSGSPIVNGEGKVVGMLVGLYDDFGDEINTIVPVEVLRKAIK